MIDDQLIGIVSAPLWDSNTSVFAGLLTVADYINVIQYYWQNPGALSEIDKFKLSNLRGLSLYIFPANIRLTLSQMSSAHSTFPLQRLSPSIPTALSTMPAARC